MDMEEARRKSMCGYGCNVIGGPFISENPSCPVCSDDAVRKREALEAGAGMLMNVIERKAVMDALTLDELSELRRFAGEVIDSV